MHNKTQAREKRKFNGQKDRYSWLRTDNQDFKALRVPAPETSRFRNLKFPKEYWLKAIENRRRYELQRVVARSGVYLLLQKHGWMLCTHFTKQHYFLLVHQLLSVQNILYLWWHVQIGNPAKVLVLTGLTDSDRHHIDLSGLANFWCRAFLRCEDAFGYPDCPGLHPRTLFSVTWHSG